MTDNLIDTNDYKNLVTDLLALMQKGKQAALNAINEARLSTYWQMGQRLNQDQELLDVTISGSYVSKLSEDLNLETSLLYRIMQFYKTWPNGIPRIEDTPLLSWDHQVALLAIKNEEERNFYLKTASEEDWGRNTLRKAIQKNYFETIKTNADADIAATLKRDKNPLYVYKAWILDVVDGDTLVVRIDLGFEVAINERVRFRGINTAELTKNGVPIADASERAIRAKEFVQEKLKDIPFVVIKSYKADKYGRFVCDLFYHPTITKKEDVATKGFFLNEELLQAGLADLMM